MEKFFLLSLTCLMNCCCGIGEDFGSDPYIGFEITNNSTIEIAACWSYFINDEIFFVDGYMYSHASVEEIMDTTSSVKPKYWAVLNIEPKETGQLWMGKGSIQDLKGIGWDSVCVYIANDHTDIQNWVISRNDSLLLRRYTYSLDELQKYTQWVPIKYGDKLD